MASPNVPRKLWLDDGSSKGSNHLRAFSNRLEERIVAVAIPNPPVSTATASYPHLPLEVSTRPGLLLRPVKGPLSARAPPPSTALDSHYLRSTSASRQSAARVVHKGSAEQGGSTGASAKGLQGVSLHCGKVASIADWVDKLDSDIHAAQRRARFRKEEQRQAQLSRRRASFGNLERKVVGLTSALRADLETFVNYLLDFGTRTGALVASTDPHERVPTKEAYIALRECFDTLDLDKSGTLTLDELRRVSYLLGRGHYDGSAFRNMDSNRSGSLDFVEMVKVFFPRASMVQLQKIHAQYGALFANGMPSARERLAPEHLAEIDALYAAMCKASSQSASCTETAIASYLGSALVVERPDLVKKVFEIYDKDRDGSLSLEEFTEMVKCCYPPFARQDETTTLKALPWLKPRHEKPLTEADVPRFATYFPQVPSSVVLSATTYNAAVLRKHSFPQPPVGDQRIITTVVRTMAHG